MDELFLSSTCVYQSSVHNGWISVVSTAADAPSLGKALARVYICTGNHWDDSQTLGQP